jgi:hypothetical protein
MKGGRIQRGGGSKMKWEEAREGERGRGDVVG